MIQLQPRSGVSLPLIRRLENARQASSDTTALGRVGQLSRAQRSISVAVGAESGRDFTIKDALPEADAKPRCPRVLSNSRRRGGSIQ
jgi:hypothetical protein